jgi:hypothetical protein
MAKSKLIINDTFTFTLPKRAPRAEEDFSNDAKEFFFNGLSKISFLDKAENKNLNTPASSWVFNVNEDPFFLFEIKFSFSGIKIGGLEYKPEFNVEGDFQIDYSDLKVEEHETEYKFSLGISVSLNWDYKSTEYNKQKAYIEKNLGASWEQAKLGIRFNIIKNPKAVSCLEFDKSLSEHKETLELLKQLPSAYSVMYSYSPQREYELKMKVWQKIKEKNVVLESSYLNLIFFN